MESSTRIFVKNIHPSIKDADLRAHLSTKGEITGFKRFQERKIAFIGYEDPATAFEAARFYDKTYIRQTRLSVELAQALPVKPSHSQPFPVPSRSVLTPADSSTNSSANSSANSAPAPPQESEAKKRKRDDDEVSQPPRKMQALDDEDEDNVPVTQNFSDDEWLRSKTNRLLDLVDPEDDKLAVTTTSPTAPASDPLPPPQADNAPDAPDAPPDDPESQDEDPVAKKILASSRLFLRNLSYSATEKDLTQKFAPFGELLEVHLCVNRGGVSKGLAFIHFVDPQCAVDAFRQTDRSDFQGRILHVLAADAKPGAQLDEFAISELPFKQQSVVRGEANSSFKWNELFMSQDAINTSVAVRAGLAKADVVDHTSSDAAVQQAIAEATVIAETKAYFRQNGVDLNAFMLKNFSETHAILVKNFPYGTTIDQLRALYDPFGEIRRILMPPSGTIAIVEFSSHSQAKTAYLKTGFKKLNDALIYVQWAPMNLFKAPPPAPEKSGQALSVSDLLQADGDGEEDERESCSVFVKNLNFTTTQEGLESAFKSLDGFMTATVKMKPDLKKAGQVLSMGFGFVEFRSKDLAGKAVASMDGRLLDGHKLVVKASHRGQDAADERRRQDKADEKSKSQRKIIIKNLPFQTNKKEIRDLVSKYGTLKALRLPSKATGSQARGFAFAEFSTPKEAHKAFEALRNTHLLGRKLVLEWSEAELEDPEAVLAKMAKKTGGQLNKVKLQQIKGGGGRQRFDLEGDEAGESA